MMIAADTMIRSSFALLLLTLTLTLAPTSPRLRSTQPFPSLLRWSVPAGDAAPAPSSTTDRPPDAASSLFPPDRRVLLFLLSLACCAMAALAAYLAARPLPVYLLDYACFKPGDDRKLSYETSEYFVRRSRRFKPASEDFMRAIFLKSGIGSETYAPPFVFQSEDYEPRLSSALQEAEEGLFAAVDAVFSKTQVPPSDVDILVVGCSMFAPCPSLASIVARHYNLRPDVKTFNLSGMGCSAGNIGIDMAANMLRRRRRARGYALIAVTESTSLNWYFGDDRSMLVTNCIFRVGAAAVLVTSDRRRRDAAKFELVRSLRTHHGADDAAYAAAVQQEDERGNVGVALSKDLVGVAGAGLRDHIAALAPRVLPLSELLSYAVAVVVGSVAAGIRRPAGAEKPATAGGRVPDFTRAFEHVCFHPGGKAVVSALGKLLRLAATVVEPARMTLHRFGNTSSSSVFYELAYFEARGRIRRGDRLWMLAFGTGFKACSLVWRALRDGGAEMDDGNPWNDCIHAYPL